MKCFYCGEEITQIGDNDYKIIPLDKPYVNLFFHKATCYDLVRGIEQKYLTENLQRIYDVAEHITKEPTSKRKGNPIK